MRVKWGETERAWNAANSLKSEPNLGSLWRGHCLCTSNTRSINKATREPPRFGGTPKVWNYLSRILARGCLILWFIMCYVIKKIACLQSVLLFVSIIVMRNILWQNAQGCLPDSSRCTYIQISTTSLPQGPEQCLQCLDARQLFLPLLCKQSLCAKCELQSVGFPWLAAEWSACWELVTFHVIRVWLPMVW